MSNLKHELLQKSEGQDKSVSPRILRAEDLFQGEQEIGIEHDGKRYRLRITRRNKLILQK